MSETSGPRPPGPSSDSRQKAVDVLCEAFARDELDLAEFERRVEAAHRAGSAGDLQALLADLPSPTPPVRADEGSSPAAARSSAPVHAGPRGERDILVGFMGGGGRKGSWRPPRVIHAVAIMGGIEIDFREAQLNPGEVTEVRCFAFWGGLELVIPPDVHLECSGIGIMGGFDERRAGGGKAPVDAPVVRITGFALMGGVGIDVREPGESARDARQRRKALRKARREHRRLGRGS